MKLKITNFMIFAILAFLITGCGSKNVSKDATNRVNEALSQEDYQTAYSIVDEVYNNWSFNPLVATLNRKVMVGELGSVIESDMSSSNKASRIILIINERSMFNDKDAYGYNNEYNKNRCKQEMYDFIIGIADVQNDLELKELLEKAKLKTISN